MSDIYTIQPVNRGKRFAVYLHRYGLARLVPGCAGLPTRAAAEAVIARLKAEAAQERGDVAAYVAEGLGEV